MIIFIKPSHILNFVILYSNSDKPLSHGVEDVIHQVEIIVGHVFWVDFLTKFFLGSHDI